MNFEQFTFDIARKLNVSQTQADAIIKTIADSILGIVQDRGEVPIPGFGRFLPRTIKAHEAKAPANAPIGETGTAKYAERSRVGFRAYGHIQLAAKVERQSA